MRHRVYGKHLDRNKDERKILFKGLIHALFLHGTIETSEAKAKAIKGLVDKVVNLAKNKNTQRLLQSYLVDKDLRDRVTREIIPKLGNRNSGYTNLIRLGTRAGDQTAMIRMSLIGAEKLGPVEKVSKVSRVKSETGKQKTERPKIDKQKQKTRTVKRPKRTIWRRSFANRSG